MATSRYIRLYHLLSIDHALSDISAKRLKIATYNDLNDPFELLCANLSDRTFRKAINVMKNEILNDYGILCFSRSWENPVLWSHYADKHKGIALGFDIPIKYATPVFYSPSRIALNDLELSSLNTDFMLRTKFSHWAYEDEVRMHVGLKEGISENGLHFYPFNEDLILREVILGHSCSKEPDFIEELVKAFSPKVKVTQARIAFRDYKVVRNLRKNSYTS